MKNLPNLCFVFLCCIVMSCTEDVCSTTDCNNGTCDNGTCYCFEGYEGSSCNIQVKPKSILITKIEVLGFPATDGTVTWDLFGGSNGDIYPKLIQGSNTLYNSSSYYTDASPTSAYAFNPNPSIELNAITSSHRIQVYDHDDFDADDFVGEIAFVPYNDSNGFPANEILSNGDLKVRLSYQYIW